MLLDSCILIDLSRKNPDTLAFIESFSYPPAISILTVTEILHGVKSKEEQILFDNLFATWQVLPIDLETAQVGAQYLKSYSKSHGTDIIDALIAATATVHNEKLATLNLKHFPMFPNLGKPY